MAVYTTLSLAQIKQLLTHYKIGEVIRYTGIADGIENTNYHIQSTVGHYILTIFEHYSAQELAYFFQLMHFLHARGIKAPYPIADKQQQMLNSWQNKPYALFHRLNGHSILQPDIAHCQQIGTALGQMHTIGQQFPLYRSNPWGIAQIQSIGQSHLEHLNKEDALLLSDELLFQQQNHSDQLITGLIHADLFCDNALFETQTRNNPLASGQLSAIVDFYSACYAPLLFDLAISVNDWCLASDHYLDADKAKALLNAYNRQRPLQDIEKQHWSGLLRLAALRFWLSRLSYQQLWADKPRQATQLTLDKDPDVLKCLLLKHRENITFCQSLMQR